MDENFLELALAAALRGPEADPNPRVGCVLVLRDGEVITGWHRGAGSAHAEADALAQAGSRAAGAMAYVTLEPCAHEGRTPSCAHALAAAGVTRVVFAASDPNPIAAGGGQFLSAQGVEVVGGVLAARAEALNATWLFAQRQGRPWVTLKIATTLDGRVAAKDGSSRWITGKQARADAHAWRARCGAIVVGSGTVFADNPQLTVRTSPDDDAAYDDAPYEAVPSRQPLRVVMGKRAIPPGSALLDASAETLQVPTHDPHEVLRVLRDRDIHHVLVEGGPTVSAAFLEAGCVDQVCAYVAPALLGSGALALHDFGVQSIDQALRLNPTDVTVCGDDIRIVAHVVGPAPQAETHCAAAVSEYPLTKPHLVRS